MQLSIPNSFIVCLFFGPVLIVVIILYRNNINSGVRLIWILSIVFAVIWLIFVVLSIISIILGAAIGAR